MNDHTHAHAIRTFCANCGSAYIASTAATGQSGSHTHGFTTMAPAVLAPEVVKEFAKSDPDADLDEWRKKYIG